MTHQLDDMDRRLINLLQDGLDICATPFARPAAALGLSEADLLERLRRLIAAGVLSRLGPMFDAARMGGAFSLCAMAVPPERFEEVAAIVNAFAEVAHNYERAHHFNMWFVLAAERPARIPEVIAEIEHLTGVKVLNLPKLDEYFIGLRVAA